MTAVIKLGGSLSLDTTLKHWLEMLGQYGAGKVVIVPGGGPYAHAVRQAQQRWQFDDAVAHRMALLAMDQYGWQLYGTNTDWVIADSIAAIRKTLAEKRTAIWLPSTMVLAAPDIAATWDITSDSLAAWLAAALHAARLILVKSCDINPGDSIAALSRRGVVDVSFEKMVLGSRCKTDVVSKTDMAKVREWLAAL